MTQRIKGDTEDLPPGWIVDHDNWGARKATPADRQRIQDSPPEIFMCTCFEEGGMLCVQLAQAARYMDGENA